MYLTKFTKQKYKHLAIAGRSLRVGSFLYYRKIEDKKFRDEEEGGGRVVVQGFSPLSAKEFNRLFQYDNIILNEPWTIDLQGASLKSSRSPFNCFVFCCSLLEKLEEVDRLNLVFNADAQYYIKDIECFALAVGESIRQTLMLRGYENPEGLSFVQSRLEELRVIPVIGLVNYTDAPKEIVVTDNDRTSFNPRAVNLRRLFSKPTHFRHEKEFRFMWLIALGDNKADRPDLVSCNYRYLDLKDGYAKALSPDPFMLPISWISNLR